MAPGEKHAVTSSDPPYRFENADGYVGVTLLSGLSGTQWHDIERIGSDILSRLEGSADPVVLVDVSELEYLGSARIAVIVRIWKAIRERGGQMVVISQPNNAYDELHLAGLTKLWPVVETKKEALEELRASRSEAGNTRLWRVLLVVGLLSMAGALAGLLLPIIQTGIMKPWAAMTMTFGGTALALIAGTVAAVRESGGRRIVGALVVGLGLAILGAGILVQANILKS